MSADAVSAPTHFHQNGWPLIGVLIAILGVCFGVLWLTRTTPPDWTLFAPMGVVAALCIGLFRTLDVDLDGHGVRWRLSTGLLGGHVAYSEIRRVSIEAPRWYEGWGWRLAVQRQTVRLRGKRVVRLDLQDGRVLRLGADAPDELANAVQQALALRGR